MTISSSNGVGSRPATTGDRLVSAALAAFSTAGFEGTSARQIERLAGVERGLVGYHFGSKQTLWDRAVDMLFKRFTDELESLRTALRDVSKRERASAMLMAYARFNARNPEFFRILILEGHLPSVRSERLALHLRRAMAVFSDLTEMSEAIPVPTAVRWFQVLGAAGALYSLSVHAEATFGDMLHDQDFIDRFAGSLAAIAMEESAHMIDGSDPAGLGNVHFLGPEPESGDQPGAD